MWLLQTTTIELKEFFGSNVPDYAILSHRWDDEEASFRDVQRKNQAVHGWDKIRSACAFARKRDRTYIWIDTCCIDKSSSAELTEAINSMYKWYQNARECYAYLKDVPSGLNRVARDTSIGDSEWFTRGWTLQELLAPRYSVFVTNDWTESVDRRKVLEGVITKATGIEEEDFRLIRKNEVSIARRMSWAARRKCTRQEDEAYCLMGLFHVNMPLLYGEGDNAFLRLQSEILKISDDESIFAWWTQPFSLQVESQDQQTTDYSTDKSRTYRPSGLLAASPQFFRFSANVRPFSFDDDRRPYSLTNRGIQMQPLVVQLRQWFSVEQRFLGVEGRIHVVHFPRWEQHRLHAIKLNCYIIVRSTVPVLQDEDDARMVKIRQRPLFVMLRRIANEKNTYCRILTGARSMVNPPPLDQGASAHGERSLIYVRPVATEEQGETARHALKPPSTGDVWRSAGLLEM